MFTYCFNNEFFCIFISLFLYFIFFMTNATKRISQSGTFALRCVALRCVALRCVALRCVALRCVALRCVALRCVALRCVALRCVALRCVALYCIVLCLVRYARWKLPQSSLDIWKFRIFICIYTYRMPTEDYVIKAHTTYMHDTIKRRHISG